MPVNASSCAVQRLGLDAIGGAAQDVGGGEA
jgi:hypothetical protein